MVSSIRILVVMLALSIAQAHLSLDQTDTVASELREFVRNVVDPAIKAIQANETNGPHTDCFGTSAGRFLRSRCCVYFSNVAGSLIEARYGSLRPPRSQPLDLSLGLPPPLDLTYQLTAKWLLAHVNDPLALGVGAERVANVEGFHQQASRLHGPLGRYSATVTISGVSGTLVKCEMGTTHTYLIFRADDRNDALDVVIDVTYRQFLVVTEWMEGGRETELMDAAATAGMFDEVPEWFVGTDAEVSEVFTLQGLKENMERIVAGAGYESSEHDSVTTTTGHDIRNIKLWGARPWLNLDELSNMHHLRNDVMLTLNSPSTRDRHCGLPTQALGVS